MKDQLAEQERFKQDMLDKLEERNQLFYKKERGLLDDKRLVETERNRLQKDLELRQEAISRVEEERDHFKNELEYIGKEKDKLR